MDARELVESVEENHDNQLAEELAEDDDRNEETSNDLIHWLLSYQQDEETSDNETSEDGTSDEETSNDDIILSYPDEETSSNDVIHNDFINWLYNVKEKVKFVMEKGLTNEYGPKRMLFIEAVHLIVEFLDLPIIFAGRRISVLRLGDSVEAIESWLNDHILDHFDTDVNSHVTICDRMKTIITFLYGIYGEKIPLPFKGSDTFEIVETIAEMDKLNQRDYEREMEWRRESSLKERCRRAIRRQLSKSRLSRIGELPVPPNVHEFLRTEESDKTQALLPELISIMDSFKESIQSRRRRGFYGAATATSLLHLTDSSKRNLSNYFEFYETVIQYIEKWYRFEALPSNISWISLKEKDVDYDEIVELARQIAPEIAGKDDLFNEVSELNSLLAKIPLEMFEEETAEMKWMKIFKENKSLPCLYKLVSIILSIPVSNAFAERVFSLCGAQWTKERNSLNPEMLKHSFKYA